MHTHGPLGSTGTPRNPGSGSAETSPITSYRQARYLEAIRGLVFHGDIIEPSPDAADVLGRIPEGVTLNDLLLRGDRELSENRTLDALATFAQAILVDPQAADAYDGLGRALITKGKADNAAVCFRTALQLEPGLNEARYRLGTVFSMLGDLHRAAEEWEQVVFLAPEHIKAHERLAISLYLLHDYQHSWEHVHAVESHGYHMPPQFRPLLEAKLPEPE